MKKVFVAMGVVALLSGCLKTNTEDTQPTCNYDVNSHMAPAAEVQDLQDSLEAKGISAIKHSSGVFYSIDSTGTGIAPTPCSYIAITYKGALLNGTVFDQQTQPIAFNLATLIQGWRNTLPLIKEGGNIHLYIPPSLGYGNKDVTDNTGKVVIPAHSNLVFDVSLLAVQ